jgi:adenosylcobyric acid synthase
MHMGETKGADAARPLVRFADGRQDGATSADGVVTGTYLHGLLAHPAQRAAWLARLGAAGSGVDYHASVDAALDRIAADLERHVDVDGLLALAHEAG